MDWASLIDFPNLVAGAIVGYALSLPQHFAQKSRERRQVGVEWTKELRRLEPLLGSPDTRSGHLYTALSAVPIDHYRRVLGPESFRLVEDLQNAYVGAECAAAEHAKAAESHYRARGVQPPDLNVHSHALLSRLNPDEYGDTPAVRRLSDEIAKLHADSRYLLMEDRAIDANRKLSALKVQVMNLGRRRSSEEYDDLISREDRARNLRHPFAWARKSIRGWWRRRMLKRRQSGHSQDELGSVRERT